MKKTFNVLIITPAIIVGILAAIVFSLYIWVRYDQPQMFSLSTADLVAPTLFKADDQFTLLIFSKTRGFRHKKAIEAGKSLFANLATKNDWAVFYTENAAVFNSQQLSSINVVIFNNASKPSLTLKQQHSFEKYIQSGGGFIGIHSAGDNSHTNWHWYQSQLICSSFIGHPILPQLQTAKVLQPFKQHPIMFGLPNNWQQEDEWYSFNTPPLCPNTSILAAIDEHSYQPGYSYNGKKLAMGGFHPIIWSRKLGKGRSFYTAMGHQAKTFKNVHFTTIIEQAIRWTGVTDANQQSF